MAKNRIFTHIYINRRAFIALEGGWAMYHLKLRVPLCYVLERIRKKIISRRRKEKIDGRSIDLHGHTPLDGGNPIIS